MRLCMDETIVQKNSYNHLIHAQNTSQQIEGKL